ncbi:maltooligosyl trehalose hydrolase [Antricoccus suffuscus]|uniref:Malto-oligosyltrehalose trehalohydrolase n=1 Tax=Antricoccus suffuscus TaxID=1629062 RepID=A0A2T0ZYY3_9ACTN|nr:malto-oligosyltrehalose trehalohydrolase [Antricoccus suffuscus]PRZ41562.1 maltooligosyl trehalose hydrolase [Antricoccus suffuscus]
MGQVAVWAPLASVVRLQIGDDSRVVPMDPGAGGWWSLVDGALVPGADYGFLLDDDPTCLPDPRSRWQPDGVHGPSRIYPDDFAWSDASWPGRDLTGAVIYELHIGTFTAGATLDSAIERLDYLVDLGITHVELLPLNAFNGVWNWGYDGVDWYAVHAPYGGPDALKRFVDAAHARGLAVVLDVVYNHLGPSGNYLPRFGPYLKSGRNTWGDLINLDGEGSAEVRRYILDNALMWLGEFHIDGLRLDAVHALVDESPTHILKQLALDVADLEKQVGRPLSLIAESDLNDPKLITPDDEGGFGLTGQWDDDVHHALHALLTGERRGYYADFGSLACLAKVSTRAFFHDGTYSSFRGRNHGFPVDRERTPGWRFVTFLQDHDQVGNRAAGDRLSALTTPALLRVGAMLLLTSPYTPMLWMGEEWAASTPWPFFTSHPEPDLAKAVSAGRLAEFSGYGWDPTTMPDPQDPATYRSAVLRWDELTAPAHASLLDFYRSLIALRAATPDLSDPRLDRTQVEYDEDSRWVVIHRGGHRVVANLADNPQSVSLPGAVEIVLATADGVLLGDDALTLPSQSAAIVR